MAKWKPKENGKHYWMIELDEVGGAYVEKMDFFDDVYDHRLIKLDNYFRTKREATEKLKQIKQLLKK